MSRHVSNPAGPDATDPNSVALVVEPTKGWWTGNSRFGGRFQGLLPAQEGAIIPLTSLDYVPGPPRTVGINLFRGDTEFIGAPGIANSDVKARLTYGAGGFTNVSLVDWMQGCQFDLVCNSLRIDAVTVQRTVGVYDRGTIAQILGCTLGLGQAGPTMQPQLSTPWRFLAAGGTQVYQIPDFARAVIMNSSIVTDPLIRMLFESNSILQGYDMPTLYANYMGSGVRIPGGAGLLRVTNGGAVTAGHQLIFLLAL